MKCTTVFQNQFEFHFDCETKLTSLKCESALKNLITQEIIWK